MEEGPVGRTFFSSPGADSVQARCLVALEKLTSSFLKKSKSRRGIEPMNIYSGKDPTLVKIQGNAESKATNKSPLIDTHECSLV